MNEKTRKIDEATDFVLRLSTATGIAEALTNMISYEHTAADLYEALIGCEWSAEAVAWAFNANARLMYVHDWHPVRTTPRTIVVEGTDNFGNIQTVPVLRLPSPISSPTVTRQPVSSIVSTTSSTSGVPMPSQKH